MSDILTQIYNECNPLLPARSDQYIDFTDVRGGDTFIENTCERLDLAFRTGEQIQVLFTGHQGCGKSSELRHLADELTRHGDQCTHKRYFPVVVNVLDYLDLYDASLQEILLAIIAELSEQLRQREGIELKSSYLEKRLTEVGKMLLGDLKPSETEVSLLGLKLKNPLRQADVQTRDRVRRSLEPHTTSLINEINIVLVDAHAQLRSRTPQDKGELYADVVLIVDNLEKILRVAGRDAGEESERALFVEGAAQFTAIAASTIYTVPLRLARTFGTPLAVLYGRPPFVLPNVKTEIRGTHEPSQVGRERLRTMLARRVHPYPLEQIFETDALEFLLQYCGGHLRQLLGFVREAALYAKATPVPREAAIRAVQQAVPGYSTSIRNDQWPLLAALDLAPRQTWNNHDTLHRELLDNLSVLEYINGGSGDGPFKSATPWYAVHPIVRELEDFQTARAELMAHVEQEAKPQA